VRRQDAGWEEQGERRVEQTEEKGERSVVQMKGSRGEGKGARREEEKGRAWRVRDRS